MTQFYDRRTLTDVLREIRTRIRKVQDSRYDEDHFTGAEVTEEVLDELRVLQREFAAWLEAAMGAETTSAQGRKDDAG